jgi:quercetin dioxygenase-like cupin family protein
MAARTCIGDGRARADPCADGAPSPITTPRPAPFGLRARQGEPFWTADTVTTVKAAPQQTGGSVALVEQLLVAGRERPARIDPAGDEIVYVLSGILDVTVGIQGYTLEAGGVLFVPQGVPVRIRVLSDTARTLVVIAPADPAALQGVVTV